MAANGHTLAVNGYMHQQGSASNERALQLFLQRNPTVRFIRFLICDYGNILRVRVVPTARALEIASDPTAGVTSGSPILAAGLPIGQLLIQMIQPGGDVWIPDWTSLRPFPAAPGNASVMCYVEEVIEKNGGIQAMRARCPRTILEGAVQEAKEKHGVEFLVGFEVEFLLVESTKATEPVNTAKAPWSTAGLRNDYFVNIVEQSVIMLEEAGVPVWAFHNEIGAGFYEISLSPMSPLAAADALKFCHETIRTLAQKNGCLATLLPQAFEKGSTIGNHVHLSLSKPEYGETFLAGLMGHFRALCGLMMPSYGSYGERFEQMGQGRWIQWAWVSKSNPVRRIKDAYYEIRAPDGMANMYLTLAGIIGAGMHAVETKQELAIKPNKGTYVLMEVPEAERKTLNITERLPGDMAEGIAAMKEDPVLRKALGEKCFDRYIYVKEREYEFSKDMSSQQRREVLLENF